MAPNKNLLEILKRELPFLKKEFNIKSIALFGSAAMGDDSENSDLDLVVEFSKPIGLKFVELAEYIENATGKKVDILTPVGLKSIRIKEVSESIEKGLVYV